MRRIRVIPSLLVSRGGLIKTRKFKDSTYVAHPINAVNIFNEKVDEIAISDILSNSQQKQSDVSEIRQIASETFMPLVYGGWIASIAHVIEFINPRVEKVIIN